MFYTFVVLTLLAAILLICVVLIQKSKGGGLSSSFAGGNQIMGVQGTNKFIEKVTWILACAVVVLAVLCTYTTPKSSVADGSRVKAPAATEQTTGDNFETQAPAAAEAPATTPAPAPTPAQ